MELVGPIIELYHKKSIMSMRTKKDGRTFSISWEFGNDLELEPEEDDL